MCDVRIYASNFFRVRLRVKRII